MLLAPENDMRNPIGLKPAGASLFAATFLLLAVGPALADKARKGAQDFGDHSITVPSAKNPGKKITGLVRSGPHGDQVRLPDGTWVLCAVTCAVTLRQNSYDLWERRERYRWWADGRPG
jgi:hypothetical protein